MLGFSLGNFRATNLIETLKERAAEGWWSRNVRSQHLFSLAWIAISSLPFVRNFRLFFEGEMEGGIGNTTSLGNDGEFCTSSLYNQISFLLTLLKVFSCLPDIKRTLQISYSSVANRAVANTNL